MAAHGVSLAVKATTAGALTLLFLIDVALAQDGDLEDILVTGSRIARPDFEAPSPIVTLPAAAFEQTAAVCPRSADVVQFGNFGPIRTFADFNFCLTMNGSFRVETEIQSATS